MTRNLIRDACNFAFLEIRSQDVNSVPELKKKFVHHVEQFLPQMEKNAENLWRCGAKLIQNGQVVMTHCHSSTVTGILKMAHRSGKDFEVISCETRPRFQGRITATELAKSGIKTTMIVDSAMNSFMKKADLCIVGADAVTSTGDLINKVGTSTLAHIASIHDVSFYSAAELYKFDPLTLYGNREKIEERESKEVWDKPPRTKNLIIRNPAFDATAARYINAYITEEGLVSPQGFLSLVNKKLKGV
jgi:ribose 1,5-bisphosphate isomerase